MSRRTVWALRLAAGLVLFWIAFHDIEPRRLAQALGEVDGGLLAVAAGTVFLTVGLIVARWRVLLGKGDGARGAGVLFSAVIASQSANIVMPFKLGDALRVGAVARRLGLPPGEVLASVAAERLYDAGLVALAAALLAAVGVLPPFAFAGMLSLSLTMLTGLTFLASLVIWPRLYRRAWQACLQLVPARLGARLNLEMERLARGVSRASRPSTLMICTALSAGVMGGSILTAFLVAEAFALALPVTALAVLIIVLQVGNAVVPVPGAVGVAQVLTVQTVALWDVDEASALAFALVLYLVARVPKLLALPVALSVLADAPERAA